MIESMTNKPVTVDEMHKRLEVSLLRERLSGREAKLIDAVILGKSDEDALSYAGYDTDSIADNKKFITDTLKNSNVAKYIQSLSELYRFMQPAAASEIFKIMRTGTEKNRLAAAMYVDSKASSETEKKDLPVKLTIVQIKGDNITQNGGSNAGGP